MHLRHLHIRNPIPYIHSLRLQERILEQHFAHQTLLRRRNKDVSLNGQPSSNATTTTSTPQPTLLTFQTHPTYTVGRRHLTANPLSPAQISFLTGQSTTHDERITNNNSNVAHQDTDISAEHNDTADLATFFPSPRGGLLTYHAPGQLTAYLIINLRTHNLTPRCYIRLLENTVIRTCARHGVGNALVTEDPGVWIGEQRQNTEKEKGEGTEGEEVVGETCIAGSTSTTNTTGLTPTDRKICAIGVHVSRGITSHGIGLNVFDAPIQPPSSAQRGSQQKTLYTLPPDNIYTRGHSLGPPGEAGGGDVPAPGYLSWGFSRIVACGLEGKSVTWLERERKRNNQGQGATGSSMAAGADVNMSDHVQLDDVAQSLAGEVARSLKLDEREIESIREGDVLSQPGD